tara:strand:- start:7032 stop:7154 length:123 start_codon:yes stop_codon:yes gene_type:complete
MKDGMDNGWPHPATGDPWFCRGLFLFVFNINGVSEISDEP